MVELIAARDFPNTAEHSKPISALYAAIKFYVAVSFLPHRPKRPISALSVAIRFYEVDSILPHRLALGVFCNPVWVAILKQFIRKFLGFF
jgi:hypothetical protein